MSKWTLFPNSSGDAGIGTANARNGGQSLAVTRSGVSKTVDNISTWIVGGAFQWATYGGGVSISNVITIRVNWGIQGDGTIVVSGPGGSLGQTTPTNAIVLNRYYYIEMKAVLGTSGSVEMRINGQSVLTLSGVNIGPTANADVVNISGPPGGALCYVDDFYVCDGSGSYNNTFLGDVQIGILKPRAEGNKLEWVPNATGTHWSRVNEVPTGGGTGPDDDTSYVSSTMTGISTTGPSDLFIFDTVATNRLVLGVQSNIFARKDDEGNRALSVLTSNSSSNVQSDPVGRYINLTYIDYLNQFDVNPIGGGTWTPTVMNTMQWGVEVVV
jgi:hypothetical protein